MIKPLDLTSLKDTHGDIGRQLTHGLFLKTFEEYPDAVIVCISYCLDMYAEAECFTQRITPKKKYCRLNRSIHFPVNQLHNRAYLDINSFMYMSNMSDLISICWGGWSSFERIFTRGDCFVVNDTDPEELRRFLVARSLRGN